jgi:uncharacterized protein (DUF934 family)
MPKLFKLQGEALVLVEDAFTTLADEATAPNAGGIIVSLSRFQADGEALLAAGLKVGVRLEVTERVEDLAYDLACLALVAPVFPKFRDGRAYSAASLLRERFSFTGEVRAVGDVLIDQADLMRRCGFDAFEVADAADLDAWIGALRRFRHVYQGAADRRAPAFAERAGEA